MTGLKSRSNPLIWTYLLVALLGQLLEGADSPLPEAVSEDTFAVIREQSPFTRTLDRNSSMILTGIAHMRGEAIATLLDSESGDSHVVGETPNQKGWKLLEVSKDTDLESAIAHIVFDGGQISRITHDREMQDELTRKKRGPSVTATPDRRPLPTDEEKRKFGEYLKGRMGKMNKDQQARVKKMIGDKFKANPALSDRQKGEMIVKILDHVEKGQPQQQQPRENR